MQLLLRHPLLTTITVTSFLPWYLGIAPGRILRRTAQYAAALAEIFAFVFLFKTLLAPWKAIRGEYPAHGFNLSLMSQALVLDITSRMIGMVLRLSLMMVGLLMEVLLGLGCMLLLFLWYAFPIVLIANIFYLF